MEGSSPTRNTEPQHQQQENPQQQTISNITPSLSVAAATPTSKDTVGGRSGGYEGGSLAREPSGGRLAEGRGFDRHDSSMRGGGKALLRSSVNSSGNQPRGSAVKRGSAARWAARPTTPLQPQAHRFDSSRSLTSPLSRSGRDSVLGHVGFH
ncbi:hypothetical protein DIPPA_32842 [Diplonema papillatum]|nr:hypothetical protein DIPPA_32842 [Diplonema papillatum]